MMERQVNHLVRLVDDLLEVSRISRGTFSLRKERVELATVRAQRGGNHRAADRAGRAPARRRAAATSRCGWKATRCGWRRSSSNLLNNAAKYTDDGGHIAVRARRDGDHAVISVRDDGVGIASDALPRMFEMFSRGDRDSGRSQGGLGIGLALSRRLARNARGLTGGAAATDSGKGSEFILRLPLADGPPGEAVGATAARRRGLRDARVLVVDDNHDAGDSLGDDPVRARRGRARRA